MRAPRKENRDDNAAPQKKKKKEKKNEEAQEQDQYISMITDYGVEIFEYMRSLEEKLKPNASYMNKQPDLNWSMRKELIGWLVQVHSEFNLLPEILFLAVNCLDRFLACTTVDSNKLQLVGATALFVASKYESRCLLYEKRFLSIKNFVHVADGAYTVDELLEADRLMLEKLEFDLEWPGPMSFLRHISRADDDHLKTRTLSEYFLDITVMDERFVDYVPSFLSAGSYCLACLMLKKGDWVFLCLL
jgi:G2/mitotic-specific cyclin 3/4